MADVLVMRDVACSGYVTGCNTTWFAETDAPGEYSLEAAATNIMKRLSFADDAGARYGSMLSYPAFDEQFRSGHLDTVMSITTRLLPWEVTSATGGDHNSFPGGEKMFAVYSQMLNLRQVHFGEDSTPLARSNHSLAIRAHALRFARAVKAAENQDFISQGSTNNATCFLGPHRVYDPFTKSFMNLIPGQGHVRRNRCTAASATARRSAHRRCACSAVWPRRDSRRCALASGGAPACSSPPSLRRSAHALANAFRRASPSRRRATRWCRSSSRSTRRWSTRSARRRRQRAREKRTRVCVWCGWGREVGG